MSLNQPLRQAHPFAARLRLYANECLRINLCSAPRCLCTADITSSILSVQINRIAVTASAKLYTTATTRRHHAKTQWSSIHLPHPTIKDNNKLLTARQATIVINAISTSNIACCMKSLSPLSSELQLAHSSARLQAKRPYGICTLTCFTFHPLLASDAYSAAQPCHLHLEVN